MSSATSSTPADAEPDDVPRLGGLGGAWRRTPRRTRRFAAVGVVLTVIGIVVATWWGLSSTVGKPAWSDVGYDVRSDSEVVVRFQLTRPEDLTIRCTVEAQETAHATVGRAVVDIPPGPPASGIHTVTVRTTSLAVIGRVRTCAGA